MATTIRINQSGQQVIYDDPSVVPLITPTPTPKPVVNLFDTSRYEASESVGLSNGSTITLPIISGAEADQIQSLFGNLSTEQQMKLSAAGQGLATAVSTQLSTTQGPVTAPNPDVVLALTGAANTYTQTTGSQNYDDTVQGVAYMGLLGLQNEMYDFAQVVKGHIDTQNELRTDSTELRQAVAEWPDGVQTQTFSWSEMDANGNVVRHTNEPLTKEQAKALADKIDGQVQNMSDMNQLEQLQLQDMSQKYQQGFQTLSNLIKANGDTIKSIVNNLR